MATVYTGPRAVASFPVPSATRKGTTGRSWGYFNASTALIINDTIRLFRLPKGATVYAGWLQAADIDTGTEALDIDLGWEDNGTDAADPDGFGNYGVTDGDAINFFRPVAGILYPYVNIIQDNGFKTFAAETTVTLTVTAAPNAGGTGYIKSWCDWEIL